MDDDSFLMGDRDPGGGRHSHLLQDRGFEDLMNEGGGEAHHYLSVAQAEATFNQERSLVAKLAREDLEDRYLRLLEENIVIKKHALKQEEKMKKMATKLIRLLSEKKRMESGYGSQPNQSGNPPTNNNNGLNHRDLETEELIEDQQHHIRELERANAQLKDKLMVAKQQILATSGLRGGQNKRNLPRGVAHPMQMNRQAPEQDLLSPGSGVMGQPQGQFQNSALLSQQAQNLLEEARNENRILEDNVATLKEQVNIFEQEIEQIREQAKIREINLEEEIGILKEQIRERECQNVSENIALIRLQQDKKAKATQISTLEAQLQALEEQVSKLRSEEGVLRRDNADIAAALQDEQKKVVNLTHELSTNTSSRQALLECEEKIRDLQKENSILRESNNKLLDSAYSVEVERQYHASENALKVQVAQLESTLKSDLCDKKNLMDALSKERESYAKLESDYKDLQAKYFDLKEMAEGEEAQMRFFAKENSVTVKDLEEALLQWRLKATKTPESPMNHPVASGAVPSFLEQLNNRDEGEANLRSELSELQTHHVEAVNELEKTRTLLRVQANINSELRREGEALQQRLHQVKVEYHGQLNEYKKLLELRATRIHKLELQLREQAYGRIMLNRDEGAGISSTQAVLLHGQSGQSMFEMHIHKVKLTQEALLSVATTEPNIFATWTFYDHDMQYTPVVTGPTAVFDCSALYKVKVDDAMLDYLSENALQVELHLVTDAQDCRPIGQATVKLNEVLDFPSNKLHGSVIMYAASTQKNQPAKTNILGTLEYWFKLNTSGSRRIQEWVEHKRELERATQMTEDRHETAALAEVDLIAGEQRELVAKNQKTAQIERKRQNNIQEEIPRIAPKIQPRVSVIKKAEEIPARKPEPKKRKSPEPEVVVVEPEVEHTEPEIEEDDEDEEEESIEASSHADDHTLQNSGENAVQQIEKDDDKSASESVTEKAPMFEVIEVHETPRKVEESSSSLDLEVQERKKKVGLLQRIGARKTPLADVVHSEEPLKKVAPVPKPRSPIKVKEEVAVVEKVKPKEKDVKSKPIQVQQKSEWDKESEESSEDDTDDEEKFKRRKEEKAKKLVLARKEEKEKKLEETAKERKLEEKAKEIVKEESESSEEESEESGSEEDDEDGSEEEEEESGDEEDDEDEANESKGESESEKNGKKRTKREDSSATTTTTGPTSSSEMSQDSEGVVVRKMSPVTRHASSASFDVMIITVTEFRAAKGARFIKNKKIHSLYVEYRFLDLPPEETETPFSLPKPKSSEESIVFNFRKVISVDRTEHAARRRALAKMLTSSGSDSKSSKTSLLTFTLVSEPPEPEGDCEEVGTASVDLETILKSGRDLVDEQIDVFSTEARTKVGRLLHGNKPIGTLTISIQAADLFKSLRIQS